MTAFEVTPQELRAAQAMVSAVAGDLQVGLNTVGAEVDALLAGGWSGSAATAFRAGWQEWALGATQIADALGRIGAALAQNAAAYDRTEGGSATDFDRLSTF